MTPRARRGLVAALLVSSLCGLSLACASSSGSRAGDSGAGTGTTAAAPRSTSLPAPEARAGARPSAGCRAGDAAAGAPSEAQTTEHTITVDGVTRTYLVSAPATAGNVPAPVIVLLHGMGQDAAGIDSITDLPARAAAAGMIVVTPQGLGQPAMWRPAAQGPDAELVDLALTEVEKSACVDTTRVYVAGFSVGAMFAATYACGREDRVAAVVAVSVEVSVGCRTPMSILAFHGTADPVVAYAKTDPPPLGGGSGAEGNMAAWAGIAGCSPTPTVKSTSPTTTVLTWSDCRDGTEVVLYRIVGGGHAWPGGVGSEAGGASSGATNATDVALAFLGRHHR